MLETVQICPELSELFPNFSELYKQTYCTYSESSVFLPKLFHCVTERNPTSCNYTDASKKLEFKLNVWFSDAGNLSDYYKITLEI